MPVERYEVQSICEKGPIAIDRWGFYISDKTTAPAPVDAMVRNALAQEEEFWLTRICCYMRLTLELQQGAKEKAGAAENDVGLAALREARRRVCGQMRRRLRCFCGARHDTMRRLLWGFFTGALQRPASVMRAHHAGYVSLTSELPDVAIAEVIQRDLGRTFPTHCLFVGEGSVGQLELRRILCAYSRYDPAVGYCQGMAFIAALLLLHAPEEEAFGMLLHMCHSPVFRLREMYLPKFPLLQVFVAVLRRLIDRLLPTLHTHFNEIGVDVYFFASQWFLTLYTYQFPLDFVCRLWDFFFVDGWRVMFQAAIAILQAEKNQLLTLDMEEALLLLKKCHEGKSVEDMLNRTLSVPLTEKEFVSLLRIEEERISNS